MKLILLRRYLLTPIWSIGWCFNSTRVSIQYLNLPLTDSWWIWRCICWLHTRCTIFRRGVQIVRLRCRMGGSTNPSPRGTTTCFGKLLRKNRGFRLWKHLSFAREVCDGVIWTDVWRNDGKILCISSHYWSTLKPQHAKQVTWCWPGLSDVPWMAAIGRHWSPFLSSVQQFRDVRRTFSPQWIQ